MKTQFDSSASYILIVDRNPDTRAILRRIIEQLGFAVQEAEDARRAKDCIRRVPPSLVLLDLMMRNMEGYSILSSLNQQLATHPIPVIALIPYTAAEAQALALPGVSAVLRKGQFTSLNLMKLIHRYLMPTGKATASGLRPLSSQQAASNMLHMTLAPSLLSTPVGD